MNSVRFFYLFTSEQLEWNKLKLVSRERIRNRTGGFAGLLITIYLDYARDYSYWTHLFLLFILLLSFFFFFLFLRLQNRVFFCLPWKVKWLLVINMNSVRKQNNTQLISSLRLSRGVQIKNTKEAIKIKTTRLLFT